MALTTLTSREFNQDASRAKQAASAGPVLITDRGRPAHVLLTYAAYQKLISRKVNMADLLSLSADDIDLPLVRRRDAAKPVEFD